MNRNPNRCQSCDATQRVCNMTRLTSDGGLCCPECSHPKEPPSEARQKSLLYLQFALGEIEHAASKLTKTSTAEALEAIARDLEKSAAYARELARLRT